jgi:hypothetical protein
LFVSVVSVVSDLSECELVPFPQQFEQAKRLVFCAMIIITKLLIASGGLLPGGALDNSALQNLEIFEVIKTYELIKAVTTFNM